MKRKREEKKVKRNREGFEALLPHHCPDKQNLIENKNSVWTLPPSFNLNHKTRFLVHPVCQIHEEKKDCNYQFIVPDQLRYENPLSENDLEDWKEHMKKQIECGKLGICPEVVDAWMCPSKHTGGMIRRFVDEVPSSFLWSPQSSLTRRAFSHKKKQAQKENLSTKYAQEQIQFLPMARTRLKDRQQMYSKEFEDFLTSRYFDQDWEPRLTDIPWFDDTVDDSKEEFESLDKVYPIEHREWKHTPDLNIRYFPLIEFKEFRRQLLKEELFNDDFKRLFRDPDLLFDVDFILGWNVSRNLIYYLGILAIEMREMCIIAYVEKKDSLDSFPFESLNITDLKSQVRYFYDLPDFQQWLPLSSLAAQDILVPLWKQLDSLSSVQKSRLSQMLDSIKIVLSESTIKSTKLDLTAIVLTDNDKYVAHVYTWKPNEFHAYKKNQCYMMGIRSSVKNILQGFLGLSHVKDIASRLAEAARRWCALQCAAETIESTEGSKSPKSTTCQLSVQSPFGPMPSKLLQLGFRPDKIVAQHEKIYEYTGAGPNYLFDVNKGFIR